MREFATAHAKVLWGLCYRITGVAADADEIVQETLLRAWQQPQLGGALEPWLTRVAANLACDRLRRRKREGYIGPWLPEPVEFEDDPPSTRYERLESLSTAFLVALEALTPTQRTVLVMRDVFELSAAEVGRALDLREENVRTVHRRARQRLEAWHQARPAAGPELHTAASNALERFVTALMQGDEQALIELLQADAVELVDGAGRYHSAKRPIVGAARVARFNLRLLKIRGLPHHAQVQRLNGLPSLVLEFVPRSPTHAPRNIISFGLNRSGRIAQIFSFVAPAKVALATTV